LPDQADALKQALRTPMAALHKPCRDIPATSAHLRRHFGEGAKIAVLLEGPQTITYLEPEVV
jgi:hypothetical protein